MWSLLVVTLTLGGVDVDTKWNRDGFDSPAACEAHYIATYNKEADRVLTAVCVSDAQPMAFHFVTHAQAEVFPRSRQVVKIHLPTAG